MRGAREESALNDNRRPTEGWKWAVCGFIAREGGRAEGEREGESGGQRRCRVASSPEFWVAFILAMLPPAAAAAQLACSLTRWTDDGGHAVG